MTEDMSTREKEKHERFEDEYALKPIPLELRKSWKYHAAVWAGVAFVVAALMGGATPLTILPFWPALATIIIGNLILWTIFTLTSYMGAKTGLNTYVLAEHAFGRYGARVLINLVASGIPSFAWYGIETWLAAAAIAVVLGWNVGGPGRLMDLPTAVFTMASGIIMAIPPILGIVSMALIDFVAIPVMALLTAYGLYLGIQLGIAGELFRYVPPGFTPAKLLPDFMIALNAVIGLVIVGATIAADTARWIKPEKRGVILAGLLGFFSVAVFMEIVGMFFAIAAVKAGLNASLAWNIILVLKQLGVATGPLWPLLVLVYVLQFTTNMLNAYSGGLALTATVGKPKLRPWLTLAGAIVGSLVAVLGIVWYWIPFLTTLANWIAPIAAVLLVEFYLISKGRLTERPAIRPEAIIAWFLGGLTSYLLTVHAPYFVPCLAGMAVAAAIHYIARRLRR
ncbi:MAG: hypothetical protein GXO09_02085 [Crenarchaeota archaeon]|nr:hypothetical protein [Thermoproteota archaeon]